MASEILESINIVQQFLMNLEQRCNRIDTADPDSDSGQTQINKIEARQPTTI